MLDLFVVFLTSWLIYFTASTILVIIQPLYLVENKTYPLTSISFYKKLGLRFAYINLNVKESDGTPISSWFI